MRKKPCSKPFCHQSVPANQRFCDEHGGNNNWASTQQFRTHQQSNQLNNSRWRKLRHFIMSRDNYQCQECLRNGMLNSANEVDHIIPRSMGGGDDVSNLQSLCRQCHAKKTAKETKFGWL